MLSSPVINLVASSGAVPTGPSPACAEAQELDADIPLNPGGSVKGKPGRIENICKPSPLVMHNQSCVQHTHFSISSWGFEP